MIATAKAAALAAKVKIEQKLPYELYKYLKAGQIPAVVGVPISSDFQSGEKEITPIIFSHGLGASPNCYTCMLSDLASYGHIVFAVFHLGGSCQMNVNKDGKVDYVET